MAALVFWISLLASFVRSWTVTDYYEYSVITYSPGTTGSLSLPAETITQTISVSPTGEHPAAVTTISTVFPLQTAIGHNKIILEAGEGQLVPSRPLGSHTYYHHSYDIIFTFTKPSGCTHRNAVATPTVTVTGTLDLPEGIEDAITPVSSIVSTSIFTWRTTYTQLWVGYHLDPTHVPEAILNRTRDRAYPGMYKGCDWGTYHGDGNFSMCYKMYFGSEYHPIGGGYDCANGRFWTWGLRPWSLAIIIVLSWVGFFTFATLLQAFIRFRSLMRGLPARRGIPSLCSLIVPGLCLPALMFNRRGFAGRSRDRKLQLRRQWRAMPLRTKISLFFRYGFTNDYPPVLGSSPPTAAPQTQVRAQRVRRRSPAPEDQYELPPPPPPYSRSDSPPKYVNEEEYQR